MRRGQVSESEDDEGKEMKKEIFMMKKVVALIWMIIPMKKALKNKFIEINIKKLFEEPAKDDCTRADRNAKSPQSKKCKKLVKLEMGS